jgi:hypothetical protein
MKYYIRYYVRKHPITAITLVGLAVGLLLNGPFPTATTQDDGFPSDGWPV